ncbi:hypothetical protein Cni_G06129 [Canna indica]|uniref:TF-B3 domain-containing protein n=1 Tax=Canna indica TaxID=4628 RepID=A0AAQ3JZE2_9LILI|nr:hypothetical protein Cni_G06129 [Canna indica]
MKKGGSGKGEVSGEGEISVEKRMVAVKKKKKKKTDRGCQKGKRKCSRRKQPPSSPPLQPLRLAQPCFFKIMIGDFRDVLFIPPKLTNVFADLVNQNVHLKDFNENHSTVKLSLVGNSLAFQEGWNDFVLGHSISTGELLMFTYVNKALFSVQIFGISACERIDFGERDDNNLSEKNINKGERSEFAKENKLIVASNAKKYSEEKTDALDFAEGLVEDTCERVDSGKRNDNTSSRKSRTKADLSSERLQSVKRRKLHVASTAKKDSKKNYGPNSDKGLMKDSCKRVDFSKKDDNTFSTKADLSSEQSQLAEQHKYIVTSKSKKDSKKKYDPSNSAKFLLEDACQRIRVGKRKDENLSRKKKNEPDLSPGKPQVPKRQKVIISNVKKDSKEKIDPSNSCKALVEEHITRPPVNMTSGRATKQAEERRHFRADKTSAYFVHETLLHNKGRVGTGLCSNHVDGFPLIEENRSDKNRHEKPETSPKVAYTIFETKNQIAHSQKIDISLAPDMTEKNLVGEKGKQQIWTNGFSRQEKVQINSMNVVYEEVVTKFLVTEDGICHIVNEVATNGLSDVRVAPVCLAASVVGTNINCSDAQHDSIPKVYYDTLIMDRVFKENGNRSGCLSRKEFSPLVGSAGSSLQQIPDIEITERYKFQTGNLSDVISEEDEKEDSPFLSRELEHVKVEPVDFDNLFSSSSFCFSLTLSSDSQCWIDLPQALPSFKGRKTKTSEKKVVVLRDPSLRSWPVIYHNSMKFIGFSSGWENFIKANKLQQGSVCDFFDLADEHIPTFQVQITPSLE